VFTYKQKTTPAPLV